jgi:hypothetical protein
MACMLVLCGLLVPRDCTGYQYLSRAADCLRHVYGNPDTFGFSEPRAGQYLLRLVQHVSCADLDEHDLLYIQLLPVTGPQEI